MPGNLTDLEIEIDDIYNELWYDLHIKRDYGWMEQARPFLHRLEHLKMSNFGCRLEPLFECFGRELLNLKSLTLNRFEFDEGWLSVFPSEMSNVSELRLINVRLVERLVEFERFLNQLQNLQIFVHIRQNDNNPQPEAIANCLYERFPQLEAFACNVGELQAENAFSIGDRFKFLEKFTNMSEIYVASHGGRPPHDIHRIMKFVPNIEIVSIVMTGLAQPPVAIRHIMQSIKEVIERRRNRFPLNDRIRIIVSKCQYRDFQVLKNINEFIQFSITDQ